VPGLITAGCVAELASLAWTSPADDGSYFRQVDPFQREVTLTGGAA